MGKGYRAILRDLWGLAPLLKIGLPNPILSLSVVVLPRSQLMRLWLSSLSYDPYALPSRSVDPRGVIIVFQRRLIKFKFLRYQE